MEIKNIKAGETLENVFMMIILSVVIFTGLFLFWSDAMSQANVTIPEKYNLTYGNLTQRQEEIDIKIKDIRDTVTEIEETESSVLTGYYTLKGFGKALLLFPTTLTIGIGTFMDILTPFDILDAFIIAFIITAVIIFVVFAVLRAIGGRKEI